MESICRRQNKCKPKIENCFKKGRNHSGKRKNAGSQHFLLFPQCFKNASFPKSLKVGTVW